MSSVCGTFCWEKKNISHILSVSLIKAKNQTLHLASLASVSPIIRLVVYQPTQTLPDGALDTCPGWALKSLCSSYVGPVQTGVGDLVLKLWVRSYPFFRTRHHHGQWGLLWLKFDNVELLPVGQHLVGFLQGGRRQEEKEKRDVSEAPNSAGQLLFLQTVYEQMRCAKTS